MATIETLIQKLNTRIADLTAKENQLRIDARVTQAELQMARMIKDELLDITKPNGRES